MDDAQTEEPMFTMAMTRHTEKAWVVRDAELDSRAWHLAHRCDYARDEVLIFFLLVAMYCLCVTSASFVDNPAISMVAAMLAFVLAAMVAFVTVGVLRAFKALQCEIRERPVPLGWCQVEW